MSNGGGLLRDHQVQLWKACRQIKAGKLLLEQILASVTPGGGKSAFPQIFAGELIPTVVNKIAWIVPRESLQIQAEQCFISERDRALYGHRLSIRQSTNDPDPSRGTSGFVTTYQAIGADGGQSVLAEFRKYRYALFLDECHHVEVGSAWHKALSPIVQAARVVVLMSGNFNRGNQRPTAFLDYIPGPDGYPVVDLSVRDDRHVIRYPRQRALQEKAIIPIHVTHLDARGEYVDRGGVDRKFGSFEEATDNSGHYLFTALFTEFALELLDTALEHWLGYRTLNKRSKLLVVAANIKEADLYTKHLKAAGHHKTAIATSKETPAAKEAIRKFKKIGTPDAIDILVTVAMAYEGLDNPPITHIACLTHIRSYPWIEQMVARATRYDSAAGPWESQVAHIFVPDDKKMRVVLGQIQAEQDLDIAGRRVPGVGGPASGNGAWGRISPLASEATRTRASDLQEQIELGYEETDQINTVMAKHGILGISPIQFKDAAHELVSEVLPSVATVPAVDDPLLTPSGQEKMLRKSLQAHCSKHDRQKGWDFGTTNQKVYEKFRKQRDQMTFAELQECWAWAQKNFPLSNGR